MSNPAIPFWCSTWAGAIRQATRFEPNVVEGGFELTLDVRLVCRGKVLPRALVRSRVAICSLLNNRFPEAVGFEGLGFWVLMVGGTVPACDAGGVPFLLCKRQSKNKCVEKCETGKTYGDANTDHRNESGQNELSPKLNMSLPKCMPLLGCAH